MKRFCCLIISLLLILSALPLSAAAGSSVFPVVTGGEFVDAWNSACSVSGMVKLERDVSIANEYILGNGYHITIDLNGHSIKGVGENADYIFRIINGAGLTVIDSSEGKNGWIGVTKLDEDYDEVIRIEAGSELTLKSGTLKGNSDTDCRLVCVLDGGTFNLEGGAVDGNYYNGDGAGVYIDEGSLKMTGGKISNNHGDDSDDYGGGVYFDGSDTSVFTMTGGEICGNSARYGGGIYFDDGYASLTGGSITGNSAAHFSAIYIETGTITGSMDRVELGGDLLITGNTMEYPGVATSPMGAVGATDYGCELILSGRLKIYGNTNGDFYLSRRRGAYDIVKDLDTTPINHAWIGISYVYMMDDSFVGPYLNTGGKDYSMCFFGDRVDDKFNCPEVCSASTENELLKFVATGEYRDITSMNLNTMAFKDAAGNPMTENTDFTVVTNRTLRQYFVSSDRFISGDNAADFLICSRSNTDCTFTLVDTEEFNNKNESIRKYYYLCTNKTFYDGGTWDYDYDVTRNVYYTVALTCKHNFSEDWMTDEVCHWKGCDCGAEIEKAHHDLREYVCAVCGYEAIATAKSDAMRDVETAARASKFSDDEKEMYLGVFRAMLYTRETIPEVIDVWDQAMILFGSYDPDAPDFEFDTLSLVLSGELGLNFYAKVNHPWKIDGGYMLFEIGNQGETQKVRLDDLTPEEDGRYIFRCNVNSLQMADTITVSFCYGDNTVGPRTTSVEKYIDKLIENHGSDDSDLTVKLAKAIMNYGHYAQLALQETHRFTLGDGLDYNETKAYGTLTVADKEDLATFKATVTGSVPQITKVTRSLSLEEKTDINIYFAVEKGYVPSVSVTDKSGRPVDVRFSEQSDGRYLLVIPDISAHKLGDMYTVSVDDGAMTIEVSALSYAYSVLNSETRSEAQKLAVSALYEYYLATLAYRNAR